MTTKAKTASNVKQAVPFFMVTDLEASLRFYVDGLGFAITREWRHEKAGGRIQWCWLELGDVALMLQEYWNDGGRGSAPEGKLGQGVSICMMCVDTIAIYHDAIARGVAATASICWKWSLGNLCAGSRWVPPGF